MSRPRRPGRSVQLRNAGAGSDRTSGRLVHRTFARLCRTTCRRIPRTCFRIRTRQNTHADLRTLPGRKPVKEFPLLNQTLSATGTLASAGAAAGCARDRK
jgi:hypothetical protein